MVSTHILIISGLFNQNFMIGACIEMHTLLPTRDYYTSRGTRRLVQCAGIALYIQQENNTYLS